MYSMKGDVILDPFLGTGTTTTAAMASGRNSIGVESDESFQQVICQTVSRIVNFSNDYLHNRLIKHAEFVTNRKQKSEVLKYTNRHYGFPVKTKQEQSILLNDLKQVEVCGENIFEVVYSVEPQDFEICPLSP